MSPRFVITSEAGEETKAMGARELDAPPTYGGGLMANDEAAEHALKTDLPVDEATTLVSVEEAKSSRKTLIDYISGRSVPATPEEVEATQPISRQLVEDYGYPKEVIQTRPQHHVKSSPSGGKQYPVDIAVFNDDKKNASDLYIVVECKADSTPPQEGPDSQLLDYMRLSTATLGMWTDGTARSFWHKVVTADSVKFEKIPNLPQYGQSVASIGKYTRDSLIPPKNLNVIFRALRNHLAGNTVGTTRDEALANQLINLVFCKIYDERFTRPTDQVQFRVEINEDPKKVAARIHKLFKQVKSKYPVVFDDSDDITLDTEALAHVVGELQPYSLMDAERDAVGQAFEVFVGDTLKGDSGQFFTPRNVVRLMVEIANPRTDDKVIDPACGPGGFLVESLRHKWAALDQEAADFGWSDLALQEERTAVATTTIAGIEKDSFLAKVAKAYMAVMGDGKGGIYCEDSLALPKTWGSETRKGVQLGTFDLVLANPPFGKDIKVTGEEKLGQFQLARKHDKEGAVSDKLMKTQNPQVLFVERCIQLASDGGTVGLILPETYFHAPSKKHVTNMMAKHNVVALIDLPHNTFRPFNNAKCIAIIFEKNTEQQEKILMIAAEEMGHNHQGKPVFRYDTVKGANTEVVWDDLAVAMDEIQSKKPMDEREYTFEVDAELVKSEGIFVPRYYWPKLTRDLIAPSNSPVEWKTLQDLIDAGYVTISAGHGSPAAHFKGKGKTPYVRVKDIINWEVYRDPTATIPEQEALKLIGKNKLLPLDILYVSRGSYRIGDIAMVGPDDDEVAITREIQIIRTTEMKDNPVSAYYLLYLLSTASVAQQTKARVFIDTTLPNIGNRYADIKLPWAKDAKVRDEIADRVEEVLTAKWKAAEGIRTMLLEANPAAMVDIDEEDDADFEDSVESSDEGDDA